MSDDGGRRWRRGARRTNETKYQWEMLSLDELKGKVSQAVSKNYETRSFKKGIM